MEHTVRPVFFSTVALFAAILASPASAQVPPDAGAIRQQIEQGRNTGPPPQMLQPDEPAVAEPPAPVTGVQIELKAFHVLGNTLLDSARLLGALEEFTHRKLDFGQLQTAVAAVIDLYRREGWVVQAFLPRQEIADGVVTIQVVEAVFGGTRVEVQSAPRVEVAQILQIIERQQPLGAVLNADAVDRALLLVGDLPGVAASGNLEPGEQEGQTQLLLRLNSQPLVQGEALLDNAGSNSTGAFRLSVNLDLKSPFQHGELLSANLIASEGSDYLRLGARLPVGADGWRVGVNMSSLHYKILLSSFAALDANGSSDSMGLEASYPLVRSPLHNLYFNSSVDTRSFDNQASGVHSSRYRTNNLNLGLWSNTSDRFAGGGSNTASLTWTAGQLDLSGSASQAADAAGARTEGHFNKLRYSVMRQQTLGSDLLLYAALSGQWADRNLDSSEKFYLGGASGVRAYPSNEASGASGQLLNLELRQRLPQGMQLAAFLDSGQVSSNVDNHFSGAPAANETLLEGYGLSLGWQRLSGQTFTVTWSHRTGSDQGGSQEMDRWWFTASLPF